MICCLFLGGAEKIEKFCRLLLLHPVSRKSRDRIALVCYQKAEARVILIKFIWEFFLLLKMSMSISKVLSRGHQLLRNEIIGKNFINGKNSY